MSVAPLLDDAKVISVPLNVNTSPLDALEVNPGILKESKLASPSVI